MTSAANVRMLTPTQDTATAALSIELVAIAERALEDRLQAEQIVAGLCRMQAALVTTATQSAMAHQREAAKTELERLVRRAALDALPPMHIDQPKDQASRTAAAPAAGKVAPTAAVHAATPQSAAPLHTPAADRPAFEPPIRPTARRPAYQPSGLAEGPSHAPFQAAAEPRGRPATPRGIAPPHAANRPTRRRLALAFAAAVVALGGVGLAYLTWQPADAPVGEQRADLPDLPPAATANDAPTLEAFPPAAPELANGLQLEAVEPAAGPLRDQPGSDDANGRTAASEPPAALADESLRVIIHHQRGALPAALASDLARRLAEATSALTVELRTIDFPVAAPRIRYFYDQDAEAATALANFLDPPTNNGWLLQNFTHFRPGPTAGTVEIFIPSTSG